MDFLFHRTTIRKTRSRSGQRGKQAHIFHVVFCLFAGCSCVGTNGIDLFETPASVHEDLTYQEFQQLYDGRIEIPPQATSIFVFSQSTIDSWDVRVLMKLPAAKAEDILAQIQRRAEWTPGGENVMARERIILAPSRGGKPVTVLGWEDGPHDPPRWWSSINLQDYTVAALGVSGGTGRVWLYNSDDHSLALWHYWSSLREHWND